MSVLGFAPDRAIMEQGVILDCVAMVPSSMGMKPAQALTGVGVDKLPGDVMGAFVSTGLAGVKTVYAGTKNRLYQLSGQSWLDVTGGGGPYALIDEERWSFAQFGDTALAVAKSAALLSRTGGAAFAEVANAPKARILVSLKGFVLAFDTSDVTYGDQQDRWWCSAYLDVEDWVPSVSTLCTTGRLVESAGAIVAAERLGDDVIAYKRTSTYVGRFTGPAEVWNWALADSELGCVGPDAVCSTGAVHFFLSANDICSFDGGQVRSIARGALRHWYVANRDPAKIEQAIAYWDKDAQLAWFFFLSPTGRRMGIVYDPAAGRWGRVDYPVACVLRYSAPASTYDSGAPWLTTYDNSTPVAYDSPLWILSEEIMAAFSTTNHLNALSGGALNASFTTGDYGDEEQHTWCDRLTLRLNGEPRSATVTGYVKDDAGTTVKSASGSIRDDGAFDLRQRARWHRFRVDTTGDYQLIDVKPRLRQAGYR